MRRSEDETDRKQNSWISKTPSVGKRHLTLNLLLYYGFLAGIPILINDGVQNEEKGQKPDEKKDRQIFAQIDKAQKRAVDCLDPEGDRKEQEKPVFACLPKTQEKQGRHITQHGDGTQQ
jgi:hypothetical protein